MRKSILIVALLVAGCSKQSPDHGEAVQPAAKQAPGPDAGPTALPGVALTYGYNFLLPAQRIAAAQEQHASQCEALGPTRCRITGLQYHVYGHSVSGQLALKLAPDIARRFGKQAIATIVGSGGMLTDTQIDSVDAGVTTAAADRDAASMSAEQADINRQLARPGLPAAERAQLQARLGTLRDAQRQTAATRSEAALLLASTPMTFEYAAGTPDARLGESRFVSALRDGWSNVVSGTLTIVTIVITLIPWLIAVAVLAWLWRRFGGYLRPHEDKEG